jgi:hypothetical protein
MSGGSGRNQRARALRVPRLDPAASLDISGDGHAPPALTRSREHEQWPPDGTFQMTELQARYRPVGNSLRSLIASMNARAAVVRPWAIILCRFADQAPNTIVETPIEAFLREAFAPGTGGLVEYWRDASLGNIDLTGSRVFGWTRVALRRDQAGGWSGTNPPGPGRVGLIDAAIKAIQRDGGDPLTGFHSQISIYLENWAIDGAPPGADSGTPGWQQYWIDGSAESAKLGARANLTPPFNGDITAHEMGHSFGMNHDADVTGDTNYHDPACIMSQNGSFLQPPWGRAFGPAICLPHLILSGWMYQRRMLVDSGSWALRSEGIELQLAPITEPGAHAHLGASLTNPDRDPGWAYLLEFVTATGWNKGVAGMPYLMIRRIMSKTDLGEQPNAVCLHAIYVEPSGAPTTYTEPSGNTTFTVSLTDLRGPIVKVHARKAIS